MTNTDDELTCYRKAVREIIEYLEGIRKNDKRDFIRFVKMHEVDVLNSNKILKILTGLLDVYDNYYESITDILTKHGLSVKEGEE